MPTSRKPWSEATITQLHEATGKTDEWIRRRLSESPAIEPARRTGREVYYRTAAALERIYLGGAGLDLTMERAKLARAQTEQTELKNALLRGELLQREDVKSHWANLVLACKEKLRALPAHARARIPGLKKKAVLALGELVDEALTELADDGVPRTRRKPDEGDS